MRRYVVLDKKIGETPLASLTAWKQSSPRYALLPATYAGRLDPMASGKLLVLLGDECKKKEAYIGLDKEYEVSVLLDMSTDTGDVLGMPTYTEQLTVPSPHNIEAAIRAQLGSRSHAYPAYSSKTVNGIPLFMHALRGTLKDIDIPTHTETIFEINSIKKYTESSSSLRAYILRVLQVAPRDTQPSKEAGMDFRQDAITASWESLFNTIPARTFVVLKIRVYCGSGAYMRTLAERIGHALGTKACAISIHRTRLGRYRQMGGVSFFYPTF